MATAATGRAARGRAVLTRRVTLRANARVDSARAELPMASATAIGTASRKVIAGADRHTVSSASAAPRRAPAAAAGASQLTIWNGAAADPGIAAREVDPASPGPIAILAE